MPSLDSLQKQIRALEARLLDLEGGHSETLYRLRRESVATRIDLGAVLSRMDLAPATDEQIDAVLDSE